MKHSSSDQDYADQVMQDEQENTETMKVTSSLRAKSPSNRRARVSFSDTDDEKKVEDENTQSYRKLPRRRSDNKIRNSASTGKENVGIASSTKGKEIEKEEEAAPRSFISGLGRRLSSRFSDKRKGFIKVADDVDDEDEDRAEDDPVMTIFESRNTQRVRFSLEGVEGEEPEEKEDVVPEKQTGVNIRHFMSRALFGSSKSSKKLDEEMEREVAELGGSLVWESAGTPTGPEVIHTTSDKKQTGAELMLSFTEDPKARATVVKLLNKARRAEHLHFRYEYAVKCYLKALSVLKKANYPADHPTVLKTVRLLNHAHHVLSSFKNSADIVKMGIKYEDAGELVRALKMYTIAYRIRRDNLSRNHPSLVVLLNMLGSIQIKRGELKEAMQIYELALNDSPVIFNACEEDDEIQPPTGNLLAKSVTYREMGTIYERWGNVSEALNIYHKSLEIVAEWKKAVRGHEGATCEGTHGDTEANNTGLNYSINNVQISCSSTGNGDMGDSEKGEMELYLVSEKKIVNKGNVYESFFPPHLDDKLESSSSISNGTSSSSSQYSHADMDLALTLHQIAQLHRCQGEFAKALDAFEVALRGMKYALGKHHPNVAAILGNIGNLQKEMGDLDAAYNTYQEVLGIESYRLGLSHPDVAITLHNIATIDAAFGNFDQALQLYRKVIGLQKKLFGEDHLSVAVTAACMGDVYERLGEFRNSMDSFEEALRIKAAALGRHSLDVARILHKLGKLSFLQADYHMADSFISRAVLIYRLNKVSEEHEWFVDANRDAADIDGAIAMGRGRQFEC
jgi:tetratricopeptide (TPR) repeat protein